MNFFDNHAEQVYINSQQAKIYVKKYIWYSLFPIPICDGDNKKTLLESLDPDVIDNIIDNLQKAKELMRQSEELSVVLKNKVDQIISDNKKPYYENKQSSEKFYQKFFNNIHEIQDQLLESKKDFHDISDELNKSELAVKNALNYFNNHCDPKDQVNVSEDS